MSTSTPVISPSSFRKIAVIGKPSAAGIGRSLCDLINYLQGIGRTVLLETETANNIKLQGFATLTPIEIGEQADAAIVVGGDGTMLGIARQLAPYHVPLIGINQGRLGFMTDVPLGGMIPLLAEILEGKFEAEQRCLLDGAITRAGKTIFHTLALNDIVVSRGTGAGMVELRVEVSGQFMYNQRSDGLIISTPTGSTAYALSAGGPILHPTVQGLVLVPIAPHALSNRPIVVPDTSEIMIEVIGGRASNINFDMQSSLAKLLHHDRIVIRRSEHKITFLHPQGWTYYDTLRKKLHWNEHLSSEDKQKS